MPFVLFKPFFGRAASVSCNHLLLSSCNAFTRDHARGLGARSMAASHSTRTRLVPLGSVGSGWVTKRSHPRINNLQGLSLKGWFSGSSFMEITRLISISLSRVPILRVSTEYRVLKRYFLLM